MFALALVGAQPNLAVELFAIRRFREIQATREQRRRSYLDQNIVVTSVDARSNRVVYFSNADQIGSTECLNASLIDVALATSAGPTYLPPHRIGSRVFLDGGIASNNPDIEALRFCSSVLCRPLQSTRILSIGTEDSIYGIDYDRNIGALKWIRKYRILDRIMSLQEAKSSDLVADLLGDSYFRIDTTFENKIELDDCRIPVLTQMIRHGVKVVTDKWVSDAERIASLVR